MKITGTILTMSAEYVGFLIEDMAWYVVPCTDQTVMKAVKRWGCRVVAFYWFPLKGEIHAMVDDERLAVIDLTT